jgi:hypothetical protein
MNLSEKEQVMKCRHSITILACLSCCNYFKGKNLNFNIIIVTVACSSILQLNIHLHTCRIINAVAR